MWKWLCHLHIPQTLMTSERVALVVGAGRGLGRAVALELGRRGYGVVVVARTLAEIEARAVPAARSRSHPARYLLTRSAPRPSRTAARPPSCQEVPSALDTSFHAP